MAKDNEQLVYHYQRFIAKGMPLEGAVLAAQVNADLTKLMLEGWKLFSTHYMGENQEGYSFMYILVKDVA